MPQIVDPILGFNNPLMGLVLLDNSNTMNRKKKIPKVPGFMRSILAENVAALMEVHFKDKANKPKALAKKAGVSLSTVQRIIAQGTGASLDNIEAVAIAFDMSVYQLLLPALEVKNPQVVQGAMKNEELMYRRWQRGRLAVPSTQKVII